MIGKKILVVDDDMDLLRGLNVRLKANGYNAVFASDGISAISVARKEKPDLIILDIGLPAGNDFTVMQRLRALIPLAAIPVIILTARDPWNNEERAISAGAETFLQKPFDNDVLFEAIRTVLGEGIRPSLS